VFDLSEGVLWARRRGHATAAFFGAAVGQQGATASHAGAGEPGSAAGLSDGARLQADPDGGCVLHVRAFAAAPRAVAVRALRQVMQARSAGARPSNCKTVTASGDGTPVALKDVRLKKLGRRQRVRHCGDICPQRKSACPHPLAVSWMLCLAAPAHRQRAAPRSRPLYAAGVLAARCNRAKLHFCGGTQPLVSGLCRLRVCPAADPPPAARQDVTGRHHTASQEFTGAVHGALAGGCLGRAVEGAGCRFAPLRGSRGEVAEVVRVALRR
jgi:hypothetical protein